MNESQDKKGQRSREAGGWQPQARPERSRRAPLGDGSSRKERRDEKTKIRKLSGLSDLAGKEKVPRCDPKQLELLKKCSEKKDMTEWNNWRKENPEVEIWLEGAVLHGVHPKRSFIIGFHLEGADLEGAHLRGADLTDGHLQQASLINAHLEEAFLIGAHLQGAVLRGAHLEGAHLAFSHIEAADLRGIHLEGARLWEADLEGANFSNAHLQGADFSRAIVDGGTLLWQCKVNQRTKFEGVGLDSARIYPELKQLLQYNIRRINWEAWHIGQSRKKWVRKMRPLLTSPVRLFWCLSDYGRSTIRILLVFLALAIFFAVAYSANPDCVMVNGQVGALVSFLHAFYFSVVTMTTLGFGDIAANPQSPCGQVLLMLQVFCGYFLLGAIVTRLSILFTAGGPAGRFTKKKNEQIKR